MAEVADIEDLNASCGFGRPMTVCQVGSVDLYQKHIFMGSGHADWEKKFPLNEKEHIVAAVTQLKSMKKGLTFKPKFTATDAIGFSDEANEDHLEFLVFPDQVVYHIGKENSAAEVEAMVKHLDGDKEQTVKTTEMPKDKQFIFVCAHAKTDKRCGYCGPILVDEFRAHLDGAGLQDRTTVHKVTHVGGHKYAGNVIVFPAGEWYGYVKPEHVGEVVNASITEFEANGKPKILKDLWRGRMGLTKDQVKEMAA
eukprot:CAMPEP_0114612510 /NCGR_PEP_ID=MMETSP0168-20121206/4659_1 /TAXON_ID=95228 ORGANISM="Vannella sp., Strain DIVA3 517/6/12" /NCGR_SAMPLE_ID=MMETSP0168 /ASSEMBLY_ACC=CAM_ASM_000044 /LENGTH=252 /DNA_ID=CAMNT_0001823497 /DNA_START=154 /DNA_END=912 /DNA_ORIENTATION=+